ncbi:MAG: DUF5665 domain-containing protein [Armatimonadota bacterium]
MGEDIKKQKQDLEKEFNVSSKKLMKLAILLERLNLYDYLNLLHKPVKLIWINFWIGVARGFGAMVGAAVLILLFFQLAKTLVDVPVIGTFVAEVVKVVQQKLYGHF